jgi:hypothetical protein
VAAEQIEGEASKITIQGMLTANNAFSKPNFDPLSLMAAPPSRLLILLTSPFKINSLNAGQHWSAGFQRHGVCYTTASF